MFWIGGWKLLRGLIERASYSHDTAAGLGLAVGVNHGGFDVGVTKQLLNGSDVVARFKKVGREAVAEGMACDPFGDGGGSRRTFNGPLDGGAENMPSP